MKVRCWGVVPAAGVGARMGAASPKQYLPLAGATVLEHSVRALLASECLEGIILALHAEDRSAVARALCADSRIRSVPGGAERCDSVLAALHGLADAAADDWVLVHDAARPCVRVEDIRRLVAQVDDSGVGGLLAIPLLDTVKQADQRGRVARTLDRRHLWRAQTPQMFRLGALRAALETARAAGRAVTDEAAAMELAGLPVQLVEGSVDNLKITHPDDLALADWYLRQRATG
jgi:2-C-methyl-D-erythritol 4-phosphate cytidylyltransferase